MKKDKIIYWSTTILIFLFEGVMPAFTSQSELAKEGIRNLGYPAYFGLSLAIAKVLGSLAITIPKIPQRIKEWAYAGLTFDFIFAFISHTVVDGFTPMSLLPLIAVGVLMISYTYNIKLQTAPSN